MKTNKRWFISIAVSLLLAACSSSAPLPTVSPSIPTSVAVSSSTPVATASPTQATSAAATAAPRSSPTSAAATPLVFPKIDRHPAAANWGRGRLSSVPAYNAASGEMWQMDLRSYDLTQLDLSNSSNDLLYADFDARTQWPASNKMPQGYDWQHIMDLGKDPGLGIRSLHAQGITGRGIGLAIIDQTLLVDHQEYADRLRLYEETDDITGSWAETQMHGPAVASIAVGKTVGVAPEADLYYIASALGGAGSYETIDFAYLARSIRRILEVNRQLPADRKIRAISMSTGWGPDSKGYADVQAAAEEAKAAGLLVICSSVEEVHGFKFHGLGREPLADPNTFESYEPGMFWAKDFYATPDKRFSDRLLVPMDSRTTASPTGANEYVFYREGGWSWSIPYLAGVYALAAQADPSVTPDQFWALAMKTGRIIPVKHNGETIPFGPIIDPVALIAAVHAQK
jgi:hypothetical protein